MSFPRARQFDQVFTESVGSDIVMFVESGSTMEYHTLANGAHAIWQAADGHRDEAAIAEMVFWDRSELSIARVEAGLVALMDAGLLESAEGTTTTRRTVAKLAAAVLLGGIGLPAVVSITAPDAASAATRWGDGKNTESCGDGIGGCLTGCCCRLSPGTIFCADRIACEGPDGFGPYECI